jgi:hypothetical protein
LIDGDETMSPLLDDRSLTANLVTHPIAGRGACEMPDHAVEGGGEEHRLAIIGQILTMRSTCGWKPMLSIGSASSGTRILSFATETSFWIMTPDMRPGVATRM